MLALQDFAEELRRKFPKWQHYHVTVTASSRGACVNGQQDIPLPVSPVLREKAIQPDYSQVGEHVQKISRLWADKGVQEACSRKAHWDRRLHHSER